MVKKEPTLDNVTISVYPGRTSFTKDEIVRLGMENIKYLITNCRKESDNFNTAIFYYERILEMIRSVRRHKVNVGPYIPDAFPKAAVVTQTASGRIEADMDMSKYCDSAQTTAKVCGWCQYATGEKRHNCCIEPACMLLRIAGQPDDGRDIPDEIIAEYKRIISLEIDSVTTEALRTLESQYPGLWNLRVFPKMFLFHTKRNFLTNCFLPYMDEAHLFEIEQKIQEAKDATVKEKKTRDARIHFLTACRNASDSQIAFPHWRQPNWLNVSDEVMVFVGDVPHTSIQDLWEPGVVTDIEKTNEGMMVLVRLNDPLFEFLPNTTGIWLKYWSHKLLRKDEYEYLLNHPGTTAQWLNEVRKENNDVDISVLRNHFCK